MYVCARPPARVRLRVRVIEGLAGLTELLNKFCVYFLLHVFCLCVFFSVCFPDDGDGDVDVDVDH